MQGAQDVLYFTHDYFTMSSDKNSHLVATSKLAKKHGVKNLVAVCPFEHDLAWSEDEKSYLEKVNDAESEAIQANSNLTLLKTNLVFGPQSHFIHFLSQCALVGKVPYRNLAPKESKFEFAPVFSGDVAEAVSSAMGSGSSGKYSLSGDEKLNLR